MFSSADISTPQALRLQSTSRYMVVSVCVAVAQVSSCIHDSTAYTAFSASVWINEKFIQSVGAFESDHVNALFTFPVGSVVPGRDNVVTVLNDNMGIDVDLGDILGIDMNLKSPRGIAGFDLVGGTIDSW